MQRENLFDRYRNCKVTIALLIANVVCYLVQVIYPEFTEWGELIPLQVKEGDWWRIITSMFLHGSYSHLGSNMLSLAVYGFLLEPNYGHKKMAFIYGLGGMIGGLVVFLFENPNIPTVGASGAIYALFGACLVFFVKVKNKRGLMWISLTLIQNLVYTFTNSGISVYGHLGGLLGGLLVSYISTKIDDPTTYADDWAK